MNSRARRSARDAWLSWLKMNLNERLEAFPRSESKLRGLAADAFTLLDEATSATPVLIIDVEGQDAPAVKRASNKQLTSAAAALRFVTAKAAQFCCAGT